MVRRHRGHLAAAAVVDWAVLAPAACAAAEAPVADVEQRGLAEAPGADVDQRCMVVSWVQSWSVHLLGVLSDRVV